jgi:GNAT superfamily N-acetyltransferase
MMSDSSKSSVSFRPASESDLESQYNVFVAAQDELHKRRGAPWNVPAYDPSGKWAHVHRHLLAHDAGRCFVAEDDGCVVGYTAAFVRGDFWYFSDLFVDPAYQGVRVGRRLLDLAWDRNARRRSTITEAIQPISTGLYARYGLLPITPMLCFVGRPEIRGSNELAAAAPDLESLRTIDLSAYGFDRSVDHEFWTRTSAPAVLWLCGGEPVAYSYRAGFRGIGPIAGRDPTSAALALRAELARTTDETRIDIPGTATALVQVALEAGLRFRDPGLLLMSPADDFPTAYALHSYFLL